MQSLDLIFNGLQVTIYGIICLVGSVKKEKSKALVFCRTQRDNAELLQVGIFFLIHLLIKQLEIQQTKPTFIISVLKVEYYVVLVSWISNF